MHICSGLNAELPCPEFGVKYLTCGVVFPTADCGKSTTRPSWAGLVGGRSKQQAASRPRSKRRKSPDGKPARAAAGQALSFSSWAAKAPGAAGGQSVGACGSRWARFFVLAAARWCSGRLGCQVQLSTGRAAWCGDGRMVGGGADRTFTIGFQCLRGRVALRHPGGRPLWPSGVQEDET